MKQPAGKMSRIANRSALIEFWFRIQSFLRARRAFAHEEGLDAREYELLLTLKALGDRGTPNVSLIAENLFVQHHIAAGLVKRLAVRGLVVLQRSRIDRRSLSVHLTPGGELLLERIASRSVASLTDEGPEMATALGRILRVEGGLSATAQ